MCNPTQTFYLYERVESIKDNESNLVQRRTMYIADKYFPECFTTKKSILLITRFSCKLAANLALGCFTAYKDFKTTDNKEIESNINFKPSKIIK